MLGYPCLGRLAPLFVASIVTLIVTVTDAQQYCGPQIFTYGQPNECPGINHNLPYQIQTPLIPQSSQGSPSYLGPPGGKSYGYGVSGPIGSHPYPSNVGFHLPVSVQQPVLPASHDGSPSRPDPFQGRTYGIGIQNGPSASQHAPSSIGAFDFGVQKSVPAPRQQPGSARDPTSHLNVQVQPVGPVGGPYGPSLWGPLPIAGIERPAHEPRNQDGSAPPAPYRRLTGLTSKIDRLLIPASELPPDCGGPMGQQRGGANACGC